ncbi:hypothetical protein [Weissella minor]|uniref:hypothetical protein n=1 Tax=Weissella minor TaxID=1620 RepID=UPI003AF1E8C6
MKMVSFTGRIIWDDHKDDGNVIVSSTCGQNNKKLSEEEQVKACKIIKMMFEGN